MGFKVLDREEGPKAVLDVLVSRFPVAPMFLIYDFGCGLLRSALHTLWWYIQDTTVVSDAFHIVNHTCSRAFHPRTYPSLDSTNTVSHEQRNKPISEIARSLRKCSRQTYIAMLSYHILLLNIRSQFRHAVKGTVRMGRLELVDEWYFERVRCECCVGPAPTDVCMKTE